MYSEERTIESHSLTYTPHSGILTKELVESTGDHLRSVIIKLVSEGSHLLAHIINLLVVGNLWYLGDELPCLVDDSGQGVEQLWNHLSGVGVRSWKWRNERYRFKNLFCMYIKSNILLWLVSDLICIFLEIEILCTHGKFDKSTLSEPWSSCDGLYFNSYTELHFCTHLTFHHSAVEENIEDEMTGAAETIETTWTSWCDVDLMAGVWHKADDVALPRIIEQLGPKLLSHYLL